MGVMRTVWIGGLVAAMAVGAWAQDAWRQKVDPWVLERASSGTEFLVLLTEQADLSAARGLATKEAKGRFVVERLREAASRTQPPVLAELTARGVEHRPYWVANMIWVRGDLAVVEAMARRPDVAGVHANPWVRQAEPVERGPAAAPAGIEWGVAKIRAPEVWSQGIDGTGVVVAGADTGYDWDHPALETKYRGYNGGVPVHDYNWHDAIHVGGSNCGADSPEPCDDNGHGTHTMGTMVGDDGGANQIGVAPGAQWIGCRNMNEGAGTPATYAECFQFFIAPTDLNDENPDPSLAPDVVNNSWSCPPSEGCTDVDVLKTVVENTRAAGIVVVVSAGNSGSSCSSVSTPAAIYEASFTIGATDSGDNIAGFSSRGPVTVDGSNRMKPNVSAPGVSVRSSVPGGGYSSFSGTSMAGPHVAGLVALLIDAEPAFDGDVDAIEDLLEQTAVPRTTTQACGGIPGSNVPNNTYGWGRVDALSAIGLLQLDVSVTYAASVPEVDAGGSLTYTVGVTNEGGITAPEITATISVPSGVQLVDVVPGAPTCTSGGGQVECTLENVGPAEEVLVTLDVEVELTARGAISSQAEVATAYPDPSPGNNTATAEFTALAIPFPVTTELDPWGGACAIGDCSLRQAVKASNQADGPDTILLPEGVYTITLTGAGEDAAVLGDLDVTGDLVVVGAGSGLTAIDGGGFDRVFHGLAGADLDLRGLTLLDGDAQGGDGGAVAVAAPGTLALTDAAVTGSVGVTGGGVFAPGGLTLARTDVTGNQGTTGGGVAAGGVVSVDEAEIADNTATGAAGGLMLLATGQLDLSRSTVAGNVSGAEGGGLFVPATGSAELDSATFSGNQAAFGGAVASATDALTVAGSTLVANTATTDGGGLHVAGTDASLANSLVALNAASGSGPDCTGVVVSAGYNLLGDDSGCAFASGVGDQVGSGGSPIDPLLGPLAANDGRTPTRALEAGSPAVDAGHPGTPGDPGACSERDQRGFVRPRDGDDDTIAVCDVGAVERCQPTFDDVAPGAFYAPSVRILYCRGVTAGCGTTPLRYCPVTPVTRAQMAVLVVASMGEAPSTASFDAYFDDIADNGFAPFINRFFELGITSGCGARLFCPGDPVTRREMAVFLVASLGEEAATVAFDAYFDDIADDGFAPFVNRIYELGITAGCGTRLYCPFQDVGRGQMAVFLNGAFFQFP